MIGRWSKLRVMRVGGGYCVVERGEVPTRGEAGRRIEVKEKEVGVCEGFCDEGTPCHRKCK